jgi:hypothetical protein
VSRSVISWSCHSLPSGSEKTARLKYERRSGSIPRHQALAGHGVEDLADVDAAADEVLAGGFDVVDDQQQPVQRPRGGRSGSGSELDRGRRAQRGDLHPRVSGAGSKSMSNRQPRLR